MSPNIMASTTRSCGNNMYKTAKIYNYNNHEDAPVTVLVASTGTCSASASADDDDGDSTEESPLNHVHRRLNKKHLSMMGEDSSDHDFNSKSHLHHRYHAHRLSLLAGGLGFLVLVSVFALLFRHRTSPAALIPVEHAQEFYLPLNQNKNGLQIWFRTWGNPQGIPLVFVHGGPGNAIADYHGNSNKRFFDIHTFFVVEVDQRGTGKSQPSVRDGSQNMKYYHDISIDQIVADFEAVRKFLNIDKWIVWGGSFGSTLAIHYGETYPESCTALFLRGLYLDTAEEVFAVYSRDTYLDHPKRLAEFDILYNYAQQSLSSHLHLDPNDAKAILQVYADLIEQGDELASWHWFVFENNLMELDPNEILDPHVIDHTHAPESLSVGFFETHLWLHGSFDDPPSDLMNPKAIRNLTFPIWVCQGNRDEVCPPQYARRFVDALAATGRSPSVVARFLNATHEDTDPLIEACLKRSLREYVEIIG